MLVEVKTWYLEMLNPSQLRPVPPGHYSLRIERSEVPSPEFSRFLYTSVGGDWYWLNRLTWSYNEWLTYLNRPDVETWVAYVSGTPAGYIELEAQPENTVEIAYFGIMKPFTGQRLGGHLLSVGTERAWTMGAKRVWVHTCDLDGPYALANYKSRGFEVYKETIHQEEVPEQPIGPWPGAYDHTPVDSRPSV